MRLTDYRLTSAGAIGSPDLALRRGMRGVPTNDSEPSAIPADQMDEEDLEHDELPEPRFDYPGDFHDRGMFSRSRR